MVSVAAALLMTDPVFAAYPALSITIAITGGLAAGCLVRIFNGLAVARFEINPVITTLGSYYICTGVAASLSGGRPVFNVPPAFNWVFNDASFLGIKAPIVIAAAICLAIHLFSGRDGRRTKPLSDRRQSDGRRRRRHSCAAAPCR